MKLLHLAAAAGVFVAFPVAADPIHRTSLTHNDATLTASYEARAETDLRQTGLGPRTQQSCLWTSKVSVERRLSDAGGSPIEALTRTVGKTKVAEGMYPGYCAQIGESTSARFAGSAESLRNLVAQAAETDRHDLHAELASLGSLGHSAARR